jgi:hypothetical protein
MHVQTHIMSGWVAGNYLKLNARQRGFCMIAAAICDLDGLSILFGQNAYWTYQLVCLLRAKLPFLCRQAEAQKNRPRPPDAGDTRHSV